MAGHPLESVSPSLRVLIYTLAAAHLGALVRAIRPLCPALQCRAPAFPAQFFWMVSAVRGPRKHEKTL